MNHEEMSDHKINCLVDTQLFISGDGQTKMFNLDNPADWGKLMNDNSMDIRVGWVYDGEVVGAELWPTALIGDGEDYVFWHSDEKIGRAISICYLESKEANNG